MRPLLGRVLPAGVGPGPAALVPPVAAGLLAAAALVGQAALLAHVVDAAFLGGARLADLAAPLLALAGLAAARAAAGWAQETLAQRASGRARLAVRGHLVRRLLALGPRFTAGERSGELANTLLGGIEALDAYLAQCLPQVALAVLVPAGLLAAVAARDPLSALVLAATFPLVPLFMWLIGAAARERTRQQWLTLSRLSARFLDALAGLPTLRAFGRVDDEARALERAGESHRRVTLEVLRLAFVSALALEALATLGTAVVAVEVGLRLLYARLEFREALFVLLLAPEFYRPLRALGNAFHAGLAGREALQRLQALAEAPGPLAAPALLAGRQATRARPPGPPPRLELADVRFAYAPGLAPALDGLSLEIPAGSTLALLGPSGAGKTTLARLLLRFLEPDAGALLADGRPLAEESPEAWRERLAWVPQQARLFHGTLRDNLLLARPEASGDELARALALAQLDDLVGSLPQGLDTPLGEGGERLSGGEAQRVALARAFLKDAPVLVLDEPTAQLDLATEARLAAALAQLRVGRTVLLVAHRLTTARDADRLALLDRGRLMEQGRPAELAAANGPYARLLRAWSGAA